MFEERVLELLRKYLGDYVAGLDREALRISVWKGEVGWVQNSAVRCG
jgi:vacuolar protein sorting-associated protein 13A/C